MTMFDGYKLWLEGNNSNTCIEVIWDIQETWFFKRKAMIWYTSNTFLFIIQKDDDTRVRYQNRCVNSQ